MISEQDLLVSLSFHNMPAELLREFASRIVKPYFSDRAIADEELLQNHVRKNTFEQ